MKQMQVTRPQRALMATMKPQPIDLAWLHASTILSRQVQNSLTRLTDPWPSMSKQLLAQQALWHKSVLRDFSFLPKMQTLAPSIQRSLMVHQTATAQMVEALKRNALLSVRQDFVSRLLLPHGVYGDFSRRTIERMGASTDAVEIKTLGYSLRLAEYQLLATVEPVVDLMEEAKGDSEDGATVGDGLLTVPFVQQEELLAQDTPLEGDTLSQALARSETAQLTDLGRRVVQLVPKCNEAARIALGREVFKPTNRCIESCTSLPWTLASDKASLGNVVDYLFWVFYEGAGDQNLRFHTGGGGPLAAEECNVVFWVKFLRNKWLRHDPDHGEEPKIKKSWGDVGETLRSLGIKHLPVAEQHFRFIHRRLLEEAEAFLRLLLERLTATATEEN